MERPHDNCYWVIEDSLLAAEYPGHVDALVSRQKIDFLLQRGFDFFLDLTLPDELEPYEAHVISRNAIHRRYPIEDMAVPGARHEMIEILDALDAALDARRRVYLHCWGGVGRTGTVVGCHLVRHGMSGTEALAQIGKWWATTARRSIHPRSPQTDAQIAYVMNWAKHDPQR